MNESAPDYAEMLNASMEETGALHDELEEAREVIDRAEAWLNAWVEGTADDRRRTRDLFRAGLSRYRNRGGTKVSEERVTTEQAEKWLRHIEAIAVDAEIEAGEVARAVRLLRIAPGSLEGFGLKMGRYDRLRRDYYDLEKRHEETQERLKDAERVVSAVMAWRVSSPDDDPQAIAALVEASIVYEQKYRFDAYDPSKYPEVSDD